MGHFEAPWVGIRLWYVLASGSHGVEALLLRSVVVSAGRGAGRGGGGGDSMGDSLLADFPSVYYYQW